MNSDQLLKISNLVSSAYVGIVLTLSAALGVFYLAVALKLFLRDRRAR